MKTKNFTSFIFALILSAGVQAAQQADAFLIDAGPCLAFTTAVERLVCFEEQVKTAEALESARASVTGRSAQPAISITPAAPAAATTQNRNQEQVQPSAPVVINSTADNFGRESAAEIRKNKDGGDEMFATIAEVKEIAPNKRLITLTNGQVWRQINSERYALASEQTVRIFPTNWGNSYRLAVERLGGFIQVERVK